MAEDKKKPNLTPQRRTFEPTLPDPGMAVRDAKIPKKERGK